MARVLLPAVLLGLAVGALTIAGQAVLPGGWNRLANSAAVWLVVAFAAGAFAAPGPGRGAVAGLVALVATLAGYEIAARVVATGISSGALAVWLGTAIVGGPVYGAAGAWWRAGRPPRPALAAALMGAVFVAEGLSTVLRTPDLAATGWVEAAAGGVIAAVLVRPRDRRAFATALLALVPITAAGVAAFALLDRVLAG
jgi:hypothetical protein